MSEELAEAFSSWYAKRRNGDDRANPPKYRKHGFKHDSQNNRIRLSKGRNLKEHWSYFILCEIETRPDVVVENVRQVRAVWDGYEWELHIVCKHEIEAESHGDETAGIDLGIKNFAAVSYSTGDHEL